MLFQKDSFTYPFPYLNFPLCKDARVPIWQSDKLVKDTGILNIDLIQDDENVVATQ